LVSGRGPDAPGVVSGRSGGSSGSHFGTGFTLFFFVFFFVAVLACGRAAWRPIDRDRFD